MSDIAAGLHERFVFSRRTKILARHLAGLMPVGAFVGRWHSSAVFISLLPWAWARLERDLLPAARSRPPLGAFTIPTASAVGEGTELGHVPACGLLSGHQT